MRRLGLLLIFAVAFALASGPATAGKPQTQQTIEQAHHKSERCQGLNASGLEPVLLAQSGCCSWHKGVCGCLDGHAACCDGTLSPSCGCRSDDQKDQPAT